MNIEHTELLRGYRIDIIRDEDCSSPRTDRDCNIGLIVVGTGSNQARQYSAPDDETLPEVLPCPTCGGDGRNVADDTDPVYGPDHTLLSFGSQAPDCTTCQGEGDTPPTFALLREWAEENYGATVVIGLDGPHDWANRWNVRDYADDDTEVDGIMFDTADNLKRTGNTVETWWTPEHVGEALRAELAEYNAWADGYCYGYRITDVNGDEVDSCWRFIEPNGPEGYVLDEARANVPDAPTEKLHAVRLSVDAIDLVIDALRKSFLFDYGDGDDEADAIDVPAEVELARQTLRRLVQAVV